MNTKYEKLKTILELLKNETLTPNEVKGFLDTLIKTVQSTKKEFEVLYPHISPGGFMIVDDYSDWSGCKLAVDEYLSTLDPASYEKHIADGSLVIKKLL